MRYFRSKTKYFVQERAIGLRKLSNIDFYIGYDTSKVPRVAASPSQSRAASTAAAAEPAHDQIEKDEKDQLHSTGSQVEVDFSNTEVPEWHNNPNPQARADINDPGQDVPEVFRQHRHQYSQKPAEVDGYRKQIIYRCGHIGTKELEIVLRDWLELHAHAMTYEELE